MPYVDVKVAGSLKKDQKEKIAEGITKLLEDVAGKPRKEGYRRHFFLRFLPALVNVARGELRFVGVHPRSKEEIQALPRSWRALYLRTKAGIVNEAFIHYGANPTEDEEFAAEGFYSAHAGLRYDLKLLKQYFKGVLNPFSKGHMNRHSDSEDRHSDPPDPLEEAQSTSSSNSQGQVLSTTF